MQPLLLGYLPILVFVVIAGVIAVAMVGGSLLAARQKPYPEKVSAYECGFEPFDDARRRFDVRFYLVAILFIIFDLEVAFLFPWAVSLKDIGWFGFLSMLGFLGVLTVGIRLRVVQGSTGLGVAGLHDGVIPAKAGTQRDGMRAFPGSPLSRG